MRSATLIPLLLTLAAPLYAQIIRRVEVAPKTALSGEDRVLFAMDRSQLKASSEKVRMVVEASDGRGGWVTLCAAEIIGGDFLDSNGQPSTENTLDCHLPGSLRDYRAALLIEGTAVTPATDTATYKKSAVRQ